MGRDDVVRLLVEPEEVHSGDEDGLRWLEETARQSRFDRVLERKHQVTENVFFNTHLISYTNTCSSPKYKPNQTQKCATLSSLLSLTHQVFPFFNNQLPSSILTHALALVYLVTDSHPSIYICGGKVERAWILNDTFAIHTEWKKKKETLSLSLS